MATVKHDRCAKNEVMMQMFEICNCIVFILQIQHIIKRQQFDHVGENLSSRHHTGIDAAVLHERGVSNC